MDKVARLQFGIFVEECWRPDIFIREMTSGRYGGIPKEYTYIILGKIGPTGKTYLATELRKHGLNAFEITEDIFDLVDYRDNRNHYRVNSSNKTVIMVLNSPLN